MRLEGELVALRAVEPEDVALMYRWENDPALWRVSGTLAPFSLHQLSRFVEEQQFDIQQTRQQRLIILERGSERAVGALDLFEVDFIHRRAGLGILIYEAADRGRGYASDGLAVVERYAREVLGLHQLWCTVGVSNAASRRLFAAAGYAECGTRREWLRTPEGWEDELLMQKILE
ncbi:MAG: GNAT family protein [Rikenellaceae bacterium]|nr:GNAT family protein [Rikenellaceae bacterium]